MPRGRLFVGFAENKVGHSEKEQSGPKGLSDKEVGVSSSASFSESPLGTERKRSPFGHILRFVRAPFGVTKKQSGPQGTTTACIVPTDESIANKTRAPLGPERQRRQSPFNSEGHSPPYLSKSLLALPMRQRSKGLIGLSVCFLVTLRARRRGAYIVKAGGLSAYLSKSRLKGFARYYPRRRLSAFSFKGQRRQIRGISIYYVHYITYITVPPKGRKALWASLRRLLSLKALWGRRALWA